MNKIKTGFKILFVVLYVLLLIAVSAKLFFEKQFDSVVLYLKSSVEGNSNHMLTIAYSEPMIVINPLANDIGSRARLSHLYEGLVRRAADLNITPALAISYGSLNDLTWEFRLRPGVLFHDGVPMTVEDVVFSLTQAKNNPDSNVKDIASTIKDIIKINDEIFRIETVLPDPLLLSKLSLLYIFQQKALLGSDGGSGPYVLERQDKGLMVLNSFEKYWGAQPDFYKIFLRTIISKEGKLQALQNKTVDIMVNVPVDIAKDFKFAGYKLKTMPSVETNFLMFNFDKSFKEKTLREAVFWGLKNDELAFLAQGFASPEYQFVGNGIFGYDPAIPERRYDKTRAMELAAIASQFSSLRTTLDLPRGLEVFGGKIKNQLRDIGISLSLNFLSQSELSKKIIKGESEFFFFGWRTELGDSADFLNAVIHSRTGAFGVYNGGNYSNTEVDRLIEESNTTINSSERLKKLRQAMNIITVEDIVGVPLFSPEIPYAVSTRLNWQPRVDSYVLAQEVKMW